MAGKRTDDEHAIVRLAFAEMMTFIEESHIDDKTSPVIKLAELAQLYKSRMEQMGVKHDGRVTRIKQRLIAHFPNMCARHKGKMSYLHSVKTSARPWFKFVNGTETLMLPTWRVLHKLGDTT